MRLAGKRIAWGVTGSHCSLEEVLPQVRQVREEGAEVTPVFSNSVQTTATRFGTPQQWLDAFAQAAGHPPITRIEEAEPIGPKRLFDAMIISPCTGNTLAKLALAVNDTPVLMAAKAVIRNGGPVVLAISTNDALGANAKNLGLLLNAKNIYFVPFGQDNPEQKPNSLVAEWELTIDALVAALSGRQLQPVLVARQQRAVR
ncbi:MAG: dipicolinate synthase subunit B [Limnochordaceae bacterium]|nr:dipicolinate synthase subunit B [Limnochordaceae bacterium]